MSWENCLIISITVYGTYKIFCKAMEWVSFSVATELTFNKDNE